MTKSSPPQSQWTEVARKRPPSDQLVNVTTVSGLRLAAYLGAIIRDRPYKARNRWLTPAWVMNGQAVLIEPGDLWMLFP